MQYRTLEDCLIDLEKNGQLIRIKEEVDPYLEMASIHLRVYEAGGPALLFEHFRNFLTQFSFLFPICCKHHFTATVE